MDISILKLILFIGIFFNCKSEDAVVNNGDYLLFVYNKATLVDGLKKSSQKNNALKFNFLNLKITEKQVNGTKVENKLEILSIIRPDTKNWYLVTNLDKHDENHKIAKKYEVIKTNKNYATIKVENVNPDFLGNIQKSRFSSPRIEKIDNTEYIIFNLYVRQVLMLDSGQINYK